MIYTIVQFGVVDVTVDTSANITGVIVYTLYLCTHLFFNNVSDMLMALVYVSVVIITLTQFLIIHIIINIDGLYLLSFVINRCIVYMSV